MIKESDMKTMILASVALAGLSAARAFADGEQNDAQKAAAARDAAKSELDAADAKLTTATQVEADAKSAVAAAEEALKGATDETKSGLEASLKTAKDALKTASKELTAARNDQKKKSTAHASAEKKATAAQEKQNKLDQAAAKAAEKEQAKAAAAAAREAARQPEQNGIRRPKPETLCGKAWAIFDSVSATNGSPASIGESMPLAKSQGLNEANVRTEYARWRKFHNVTGRIDAPKPTQAPSTEPAVAPAAPTA